MNEQEEIMKTLREVLDKVEKIEKKLNTLFGVNDSAQGSSLENNKQFHMANEQTNLNLAKILLLNLGIEESLLGFKYLQISVIAFASNKEEKICKIYEEIAEKFNTTANAVSRSIGYAKSKIPEDKMLILSGRKHISNQNFVTLLANQLSNIVLNGSFK